MMWNQLRKTSRECRDKALADKRLPIFELEATNIVVKKMVRFGGPRKLTKSFCCGPNKCCQLFSIMCAETYLNYNVTSMSSFVFNCGLIGLQIYNVGATIINWNCPWRIYKRL